MSSKTKTLSKARDIDWMKLLLDLQLVNAQFLVGLYYLTDFYFTTIVFSILLALLGILGVTAGSHRLWAHRSYKASLGLRIFLALCQTLACHGTIYEWVRWHRLHHKHFGTDLDPYNPNKGFFFSHIKSVTLTLSEAQEHALNEIDMTDVEEDKVVMFQKKFYYLMLLIFGILLPINAPAEYWGESIINSIFSALCLRSGIILHVTNAIHSAYSIWGLKPGEKYPCDTNLVFLLTKTNWLSYHYLAPWDYQTSEFGSYATDCVTKFIKICTVLEWASDLRTIDNNSVKLAISESVQENKPISESLLDKRINNCGLEQLLKPHSLY